VAHQRNVRQLIALGALACLAAGCSGVSHPSTSATGHPDHHHTVTTTTSDQQSTTTTELLFGQQTSNPPAFFGAPEGPGCAPSQLSLKFGGDVSEKTEQNSIGLTLTNISTETCHLIGYPGIVFVDAVGDDLPLIYLRGGDQMVTYQPPKVVDLPPASISYVLLNQNACVGRQVDVATGLRLVPPNTSGTLTLPATAFPSVNSCVLGDPGNTLTISPVEPTAADTFSS
jgi:hypothetical protein